MDLIKKLNNNNDFKLKIKKGKHKYKTKKLQKVLLIPKYSRKGTEIRLNNINRVIIENEEYVKFCNYKDDSVITMKLKEMRDIII